MIRSVALAADAPPLSYDTNGTVSGDSTLVLLPGLFAGGWMWEPTWGALSAAGWPAMRLVDAISQLEESSDGVEALRGALRRTLAALPGDRFVLCGNSMGALMALDFAATFPERVAAVVLSGAPGLDDGLNLGVGTPRRATRDYMGQLAARLFYDTSFLTEEMLRRAEALLSEKRHVRNVFRALKAARRYDVPRALARVTCPMLLVWGEHDNVTPRAKWAALARDLPDCTFVTVPACGHSPMAERPVECNRILLSFLEQRRTPWTSPV